MKNIKSYLLSFALFALAVLPVKAQDMGDFAKIQRALDDFSGIMGKTLTSNATLGLTWSDAYIGQLIGKPPHFGIGLSGGATLIKLDDFNSIFSAFDISKPDIKQGMGGFDMLPYPNISPELRIGGFFLPFDIGFKIMPLPTLKMGEMDLKYLMVGGDFRYAILRDKGFIPAVSVGIGYTYLDAGMSYGFGSAQKIPLDSLGTIGGTNYANTAITVDQTRLNFTMQNHTLDLKVQASKHLLFITPYLGLGASYGWSTVSYSLDGNVTHNVSGGPSLDSILSHINDWLSGQGINSLDMNSKSISATTKYEGFNFRAFGGLSFDIFVIRLDFTGVYNFSGNFGLNVGLRFQL